MEDTTPLWVYIGMTVITSIIYYGYGMYKGKGFPGVSKLGIQICSVCCCAFVIVMCSKVNNICAWMVAVLGALLGLASTINYIRTGGDSFMAIIDTLFK